MEPTTRVDGKGASQVRIIRPCRVTVLNGREAGRVVRGVQGTIRIGSHASNDLVLPEATVSKFHLEVRVVEDGYEVTDLGSSNGTRIGTMRVGQVTVREPVTLEIGEVRLALTPGADEEPVAASARTEFGSLRGQSVGMRELFGQLESVSQSDCSLLIEGETGVGKERVAQSVHDESPRTAGPFVVVDCAALMGELMESELFGHVRGAFTGADKERTGSIERANGGTLFLDEIGELPMALQVKLLGVLERRKVTKLGSQQAKSVDVRVIAATNKDLRREVNAGRFRADLYYRLAVVRVRVPPLRERVEDIPLIVDDILQRLRTERGEQIPATLSAVAMARLSAQLWPGNVRELKNAIERLAHQIEQPTVSRLSQAREPFVVSRDRFMADFDRRFLLAELENAQLNVSRAAARVGLDRRYFQRLLKQHGISAAELKNR